MADRRVKLIIDVDGKDVDKTAESIRRLGYSVSTLKGGKLVLDTSDVDRAQRSVSNLGAAIGTALGSLAASAVSRLTYEFTNAVKSVLNYSSSLEQAKIGFETMTGSAEIAQQHLKDLQNFAKSTPSDPVGSRPEAEGSDSELSQLSELNELEDLVDDFFGQYFSGIPTIADS